MGEKGGNLNQRRDEQKGQYLKDKTDVTQDGETVWIVGGQFHEM
jgi:hypothetical protein